MKEFLSDLERAIHDFTCEYYLYGSGQKKSLEFTPIFKKYSYLFTKNTIDSIPPENRKLRGFLIGYYIDEKTSPLNEAITRKKAEKRFRIDGHEITYSKLQVLLNNLPVREEREKLYKMKVEFIDKELNPLYTEYFKKIYSTIREFPYEGYYEYLVKIQNIDFDYYNKIFSAFLKDTEQIYTHYMNKQLYLKLGISLNSAAVYDITYLFRGKEYDHKFKSNYLMDFLKEFLINLGIDLTRQKNVIIDIEDRPTKSPRAFCAPCDIPNKIYLSVLPQGGYRDFETVLHEMGHTQHFAHTSSALKVEDRYFGDMGLSEVYAFLFQYMLTDPVFVEYYFDIYGEDLDIFIKNALLSRLFIIRRYIGKFNYELWLHKTENLKDAPQVYERELEKSLYIKIFKELFLDDLDLDFYSANYLRAWFAEASVTDFLKTKFGKKWFINKKAGELLKELWFEGMRWQIEEMLSQVTGRPFDIAPLIDTFKRHLRIS